MPDPAGPFTLADLDRCEADVAAVEQALADLDTGSYGRCDTCGGPIEADVLAADAFARRCAAHRPVAVEAPPTT